MHILRLFVLAGSAACLAFAQAQTGPALAVDAGAARLSISPDIYGINNYSADETASGSSLYWDLHPDPTRLSASADLRIRFAPLGWRHGQPLRLEPGRME